MIRFVRSGDCAERQIAIGAIDQRLTPLSAQGSFQGSEIFTCRPPHPPSPKVSSKVLIGKDGQISPWAKAPFEAPAEAACFS
jgi:hypothetical protein